MSTFAILAGGEYKFEKYKECEIIGVNKLSRADYTIVPTCFEFL